MNSPLRVVVGIATAARREQIGLTMRQLALQRRLPARILVCPARAEDFDARDADSVACPVERVEGRRGLCAQRNAILDRAGDADVIVFFDDDYYPADDYVERVSALFLRYPDVVIATNRPKLDGAVGPGVGHEEALRALAKMSRRAWQWPTRSTRSTYGGYGCNMAIRLAPVRAFHVRFDEDLPLYGWLEDIDFSRRLAPYGRIVRCPALRGVHLGTKRGRSSGVQLGYSQIANPVYMLQKRSMDVPYALKHMGRNLAKNVMRAPWPEPWVDRTGRLKGNALALRDLLAGRLHPRRVLEL